MKTQEIHDLSTSFLQLARNIFRVFIILITILLLESCFFSANTAPTSDISRVSVDKSTAVRQHIVKSGETLYSIAWRYGLDYKVLARNNGVKNNFLIYAGQTLILPAKAKYRSPVLSASSSPTVAASTRTSSASVNRPQPLKADVSRKRASSTSSSVKKSPRSENQSTSTSRVAKSNSTSKKVIWQWPTRGKVITNFSSANGANKGIDLKGKKGDSVRAAALGRVVYAGSGLRGYGKLVIIKHNDTYLSAYAHNDRIRVKEGQNVKAGQHIADIGSSGSRTESVKLHFEIRQNGQPVNPLKLLPKRKT